ncbi:MAG: MarR family winged helix-turn-helix transcriptional regulator [Actinomycetota bacterium]
MTTRTKRGPTRGEAILPLASSLRLAVMRLARRLRQQTDGDATPSMLSAISTIERYGPMTLSELAAHERVKPPTVTTIIGRLEAAGLVARDTDLDDRRIAWISLSPEGRKFVEATRSRKTAYLATRIGKLSAQDRAALSRAVTILERLVEEDR